MLMSFLKKLKAGTEELNFGRDVIAGWARDLKSPHLQALSILDVGLGQGADLLNIQKELATKPELHGVESYPDNIKIAAKNGITTVMMDVERDRLPYADAFFDVVVCNQVLEHAKDIFFMLSEMIRVLKPSGKLIIGVPNLASLHNRISLLVGNQPPAIKTIGPHVRGFTAGEFIELVEYGGFLNVQNIKGSGFYPFPKPAAKFMSKILPRFSVCLFFLIERTLKKEGSYLEIFTHDPTDPYYLTDTNYYRGEPVTPGPPPKQRVSS